MQRTDNIFKSASLLRRKLRSSNHSFLKTERMVAAHVLRRLAAWIEADGKAKSIAFVSFIVVAFSLILHVFVCVGLTVKWAVQ